MLVIETETGITILAVRSGVVIGIIEEIEVELVTRTLMIEILSVREVGLEVPEGTTYTPVWE